MNVCNVCVRSYILLLMTLTTENLSEYTVRTISGTARKYKRSGTQLRPKNIFLYDPSLFSPNPLLLYLILWFFFFQKQHSILIKFLEM